MPRIGYLGAGILAVKPNPRDAFMQGLRELGYVEGKPTRWWSATPMDGKSGYPSWP